ncbi:MAG: putative spermidine/putrescine transport system permease protein [Cellvibrionaceae bacterium]|jgi:putative spermidine/putrescine transport system permease protein
MASITDSADTKSRTFLQGRFNRWTWLLLPALLFLAIFFIYPLFEILKRSVTEPTLGLSNFVEFFQSPVFSTVLINTLKMSLYVMFFCLLIGYPYAYLMNHSSARVAGLLLIAVLIPFWSSILVRTYAWTVLLQRTGVVNSVLIGLGIIEDPLKLLRNFPGIIIGMTHILLPFMVLPIYSVMQRINKDFVVAAESLGARPFRAFREVYLPLSLPGVYAGSLLVFVVSLGYYITPALLGSPRETMMGAMVVQQVQQVLDWGMGSALGVVLLITTLIILGVVGRVVNINEVLGGSGGVE